MEKNYPNKTIVISVALTTLALFLLSEILAYFKFVEQEVLIFSGRTFSGMTAAFWFYHLLRLQIGHSRELIIAVIILAIIFGQIGEVLTKILFLYQ